MIDYEKNNKYAKHVLNLIILSTALFTSTLSLKQNVEVIDLVVTSALARKLQNLFYLAIWVLDYADYESDIGYFIRTQGGPGRCTWVPHCGYMRYYGTQGMILVDLDESYYFFTLLVKKCHFYGVKIRVFFLLHQIGTQFQAKRSIKTYVIQLVKGYQNHHHKTFRS